MHFFLRKESYIVWGKTQLPAAKLIPNKEGLIHDPTLKVFQQALILSHSPTQHPPHHLTLAVVIVTSDGHSRWRWLAQSHSKFCLQLVHSHGGKAYWISNSTTFTMPHLVVTPLHVQQSNTSLSRWNGQRPVKQVDIRHHITCVTLAAGLRQRKVVHSWLYPPSKILAQRQLEDWFSRIDTGKISGV